MDSDSRQAKECRVAIRGILAFSREPELPLKAQRSAAGRAMRKVGSYLVPMEVRRTGTFCKSTALKQLHS